MRSFTERPTARMSVSLPQMSSESLVPRQRGGSGGSTLGLFCEHKCSLGVCCDGGIHLLTLQHRAALLRLFKKSNLAPPNYSRPCKLVSTTAV